MQNEEDRSEEADKNLAAVCGLYCGACSLFIATTEEPERLRRLAEQLNLSEEECRCYGCRSDKRVLHCQTCRIAACAADRGVSFCSECDEYPCDDLREFQSAKPHRVELWMNLERIRSVGYKQWIDEMRENYACPRCRTVNSAYDPVCRKCGADPASAFAARHRQVIEEHSKKS